MTQVDATKCQALRERKALYSGNGEALISVDTIVVVPILIVIVVILRGECGGLWLRPLSQDLFSRRVVSGYFLAATLPPWGNNETWKAEFNCQL